MQSMKSNSHAYYDPPSNRIWYSNSKGGGVVGTVVDDGGLQLNGKQRLRGEILEIVDVEPQSNDVVQNQPPHPFSKSHLLQTLHTKHTSQTQSLFQQHQKERHALSTAIMPSEKQRDKARLEMEKRQERELLELQDRQAVEMMEVMSRVLSEERGMLQQQQQQQQQQHEEEAIAPQQKSKSKSRKKKKKQKDIDSSPYDNESDHEDKPQQETCLQDSFHSDYDEEEVQQQQLAGDEEEFVPQQKHRSKFSSSRNKKKKHRDVDTSPYDTDSDCEDRPLPAHTTEEEQHLQYQDAIPSHYDVSDRKYAVPSAFVRQNSFHSDDEEQEQHPAQDVGTTEQELVNNKPSPEEEQSLDRATLEANKTAEIKAIMRNKSLDREARRVALVDVKAKYSKLIANATLAGEDNAQSSADRRKLEIQSIMKDRSLTKEERVRKLDEVKKRYHLEKRYRRATTDVVPTRATVDSSEGRIKSARRAVSMNEAEDVGALKDESGGHNKVRSAVPTKAEEDLFMEAIEKASVKMKDTNHDEDLLRHSETISDKEDDEVDVAIVELAPSMENSLRRRRSSYEDEEPRKSSFSPIRQGETKSTINRRDSMKSAKSVTISEPNSTNTSDRSLKANPLENAEVNKTPIKQLIRKLEKNDPSIYALKLDGRGKIKQSDWTTFFETLESNTSLTHLSLGRCGITDDLAVGLILALVENSTMRALHLHNNREITDVTGKGIIKVLKESNSTLKQLDLSKTKVKKSTLKDIQTIMDDRDEEKKRAKARSLHESKIMELLSTTASDAFSKSEHLIELDSDDDSNASEGSDKKNSLRGDSLRKSVKSNKSNKSAASNASSKKSASSKNSKKSKGTRASSRANAHCKSMRASMTAHHMATMGGDMVSGVGADPKVLREQRKMRGECVMCGQKCFEKKLFKSIPLTIAHKVYEGRCLKCNPM